MRRVGALLLVAVLAGMPLLGCSGGTTGGSRQWLYEDLCVELLNRAPGYEGEVTEEVAHSMAKGFFVEEDELAEVPRHDWSLYDVRATAHTESAPGYNGVLSGAGGDRTFGCGTGGGRMPRGAFSDVVCIVTKPTSAHADTVRGGTGTSLRAVIAEMNGQAESNEWAADERLSLLQLRDRVVDALLATHGEYFSQSRAALGLDPSDAAVRNSAEGMVRLAFQTVGGSYDAPTVQSLAKVVDMLAERVLGWGASPDRVFEHHCTLMREIGRLEMMQTAGLDAPPHGN